MTHIFVVRYNRLQNSVQRAADNVIPEDLASRYPRVEFDKDIRLLELRMAAEAPDISSVEIVSVAYTGVGGLPVAYSIGLELIAAKMGLEPHEFGKRR